MHMSGGAMKILLSAVLTLTVLGVLFAQGERGAITGLITDPSGSAIPNAEVVAKDSTNGLEFKARTTTAGIYRIPYMPPATYRVTVTVAGFKTAVVEPVLVSVADVVTGNVGLRGGGGAAHVR